ncbi:MAG: hypothetical protein JWN25_2639 [Verrucomicrobiales bacterium]|nr:hypothetical protein [Verrucomicrobiales bacterium]
MEPCQQTTLHRFFTAANLSSITPGSLCGETTASGQLPQSATGDTQSTNVLLTVLPENNLGYFVTTLTNVHTTATGLPPGMSRSYDS